MHEWVCECVCFEKNAFCWCVCISTTPTVLFCLLRSRCKAKTNIAARQEAIYDRLMDFISTNNQSYSIINLPIRLNIFVGIVHILTYRANCDASTISSIHNCPFTLHLPGAWWPLISLVECVNNAFIFKSPIVITHYEHQHSSSWWIIFFLYFIGHLLPIGDCMCVLRNANMSRYRILAICASWWYYISLHYLYSARVVWI